MEGGADVAQEMGRLQTMPLGPPQTHRGFLADRWAVGRLVALQGHTF
jgi:hypothetical protein